MAELRFTLLGEGSSDRALLPVIEWLLGRHLPAVALQSAWADLGRLVRPPRTLAGRIATSVDLYPCELLFVHRDADRERHIRRVEEVQRAAQQAGLSLAARSLTLPPVVAMVPVRMLEAWLLTDEAALRMAAGNPNGRDPLDLPRVRELETIANPKEIFRQAFLTASGLSSRRRRGVSPSPVRVAQLTGDFSPLLALPAFQALEDELLRALRQHRWTG